MLLNQNYILEVASAYSLGQLLWLKYLLWLGINLHLSGVQVLVLPINTINIRIIIQVIHIRPLMYGEAVYFPDMTYYKTFLRMLNMKRYFIILK